MEYLVDGVKYSYSYQELKEQYMVACSYTNEQFIGKLPEMLHLACFICYVKEIPTYACLSDRGIVHELAHMLHIPDYSRAHLKYLRNLFKKQLQLS